MGGGREGGRDERGKGGGGGRREGKIKVSNQLYPSNMSHTLTACTHTYMYQ